MGQVTAGATRSFIYRDGVMTAITEARSAGTYTVSISMDGAIAGTATFGIR